MRKAYDIILQSEVSAVLAVQSGGFEPYRYECACCGEEVYIAASYSTSMVPHFRHRSGNNDVACENYLGQYGAISVDSRSRKSHRERVEFYFENSNKNFCLGLRFSADEIQHYEQQNVDFELRTNASALPFYTLAINNIHFAPDVPTMISLNNFSFCYYLSNTLNGIKRKYEFFKFGNTPTFFKLQGNDSDFKAKLVRGNVLFTNVPYFVAFHSKDSTQHGIRFPDEIQANETFCFETMGLKFLGMTLLIQKKTDDMDRLLNNWGYQLEASETLTLLWPPAPVIDDVSVVTSNKVFVFTSFDLQAHGNINVHSKDISLVNHGISRVLVKQRTIICKDNTEIVIDKAESPIYTYNQISTSETTKVSFTIPDDGSWFLFNRSGVISLKNGQVVYLTPESVIKRYESNYLTHIIHPCRQKELVNEKLLDDILMHCKRTEILDFNQFMLLALGNTASQYIDKCSVSGYINSVAKQFIMEGLL
ncbi:hypothetical protein EDC14_102660 [Hydrogenispora ethanolica]|uniref:Uncharacterized protein n=1 Tax=Hydrogenispora ethanolica TaxID=1082276 RepID=A0A4R1R9F7_HYDET|nr:hypothetical protein [Hydrogenispora ethanolica]TCL62316.1 hypothetical protein EDC14_102660 [Hydrogenispora ethanolica]